MATVDQPAVGTLDAVWKPRVEPGAHITLINLRAKAVLEEHNDLFAELRDETEAEALERLSSDLCAAVREIVTSAPRHRITLRITIHAEAAGARRTQRIGTAEEAGGL